jgi:hypothetical protein
MPIAAAVKKPRRKPSPRRRCAKLLGVSDRSIEMYVKLGQIRKPMTVPKGKGRS